MRRANEKGHVEQLVGFGRRNFLVPVPRVNSLEDLNEHLQARCTADLDRQLTGKFRTKRALLAEEREVLLDLPKQAFDARRVTQGAANSLSLIRFDTNSYSVPVKYAHREITVLVKHHLKALKLPTMHNECEKTSLRASQEQSESDHFGGPACLGVRTSAGHGQDVSA